MGETVFPRSLQLAENSLSLLALARSRVRMTEIGSYIRIVDTQPHGFFVGGNRFLVLPFCCTYVAE